MQLLQCSVKSQTGTVFRIDYHQITFEAANF